MKHILIETKNSFDLVEEKSNNLIKSYPIKNFECHSDCRGKIEALEKIKELEGLEVLDIRDRIKKGRRC